MKSLSELTDFYYKELYPSLNELEKTRMQIISQLKWYGGMGAVVFTLTAIWMGKNFGLFHPLMIAVAIGFIVLASITYRFMTQG
ncbi:MAG: Galanin, partial [Sulfuricurvum sp.]